MGAYLCIAIINVIVIGIVGDYNAAQVRREDMGAYLCYLCYWFSGAKRGHGRLSLYCKQRRPASCF